MLLSPLVLQRLGLMRGICSMQVATGLALAGLAFAPGVLAAPFYALYTAFQFMSEPGLYSLLMNGVDPESRTGASALNFIVIFSIHAVTAWVAGAAITEFGYSPVLAGAAVVTFIAARAMMWVTRDSGP
jgi:predicted MFS family arabinose efflux permease